MGNETNEKMPFSIGSQENSLVSSGHSPFCLDTPVNGSPLSGSAPALPGLQTYHCMFEIIFYNPLKNYFRKIRIFRHLIFISE